MLRAILFVSTRSSYARTRHTSVSDLLSAPSTGPAPGISSASTPIAVIWAIGCFPARERAHPSGSSSSSTCTDRREATFWSAIRPIPTRDCRSSAAIPGARCRCTTGRFARERTIAVSGIRCSSTRMVVDSDATAPNIIARLRSQPTAARATDRELTGGR